MSNAAQDARVVSLVAGDRRCHGKINRRRQKVYIFIRINCSMLPFLCFLLCMFLLYITVLLPVGVIKDEKQDIKKTQEKETHNVSKNTVY